MTPPNGITDLGPFRFRRENVFLLVCAVGCLFIIEPIIVPVAAGAVLAFVSEGAFEWLLVRSGLEHRAKAWRWVLALLLIAGILAVFLVPMALFLVTTIQQAALLFDPANNPLLRPGAPERIFHWVSSKLAEFGVSLSIPEIVVRAKDGLARASSLVAGSAQRFLVGTPEGVISTFLLLMSWSVFLVEGRSIRAFALPKLIPWRRERRIIAETTGDVLRAVIVANVLVSLVQSLIVLLFLVPTGTPNALLWSGLAFFLSFIPLVGTAPIMLGAVAYAFMQDRPGAGAALVVGVLVVGAVDNVLRPFFVKGRAALSFFWVFVAFIGGIAQFGVAGTVLGPLFFALFAAAAKALQESDALEEALAAKERVPVDSESDPGGASAPSVTSESP